jgi:hypothetical protein
MTERVQQNGYKGSTLNTNRRRFLSSLAGGWVPSVLAGTTSRVVWSASVKEPPQVVYDAQGVEPVGIAPRRWMRPPVRSEL